LGKLSVRDKEKGGKEEKELRRNGGNVGTKSGKGQNAIENKINEGRSPTRTGGTLLPGHQGETRPSQNSRMYRGEEKRVLCWEGVNKVSVCFLFWHEGG